MYALREALPLPFHSLWLAFVLIPPFRNFMKLRKKF